MGLPLPPRSRGRLVGIVLGGVSMWGCVPDIAPPWLIERPTELGLDVSVVASGPWGPPSDPRAPRSFREVLPGDVARIEPFVVDTDGPIPASELDWRWALCDRVSCLRAAGSWEELAPCGEQVATQSAAAMSADAVPSLPCALGDEASTTFEVPLFVAGSTDFSDPSTWLVAASVGPSVIGIGGRRGERTAADCGGALDDLQSLSRCLLMVRQLRYGPFSVLVDLLGLDASDLPDRGVSEPLGQRPRNRNPAVESFEIRGASGRVEPFRARAGEVVRVTRGDHLEVRYVPDGELDFDDFDAELDGEMVEIIERIEGRWFADVLAPTFEFGGQSGHVLSWVVSETTRVFFVAEDDGGAEAWGMLTFEVDEER